MSKVPFSEEQMTLLKNNPYTFAVTPSRLYLSKEFKELFYKEYQTGKLPRKILEENGYPSEILGSERIWGIASIIKREAERSEGFSEGTQTSRKASPVVTDQESIIRHLQHEVEYLRQEVDFLKKISSIRNTRK